MIRIQSLVSLLVALPVAAWLVYADSRTDDTGIIAGLVLLFALAFSMAKPRWAWRWGLFWGLCIPLTNWLMLLLGVKHGDPRQTAQSLLALIPAFIGAAVGAACGSAYRQNHAGPRVR